MKLVSVVGARPQFVKAAVIARAVAARAGAGRPVEHLVVHTGQHFDPNLSAVFFQELGLPDPAHHLGVHSLPHGALTGRMMEALEPVLLRERPDWVLAYGDTDSTLAAALVAAKLNLPLAHVEAGLRSHNRGMPEEQNRLVADHLARLLLCPTQAAMANLAREGIVRSLDGLATPDGLPGGLPLTVDRDRPLAVLVGDVMHDALLFFRERARRECPGPEELGLAPGGYLLATLHRQENTDDPARLAAFWRGLARVAESLPVVLPLHPRTRAALARLGLPPAGPPGLLVQEPLPYLRLLRLAMDARLVATDSGGLQKEAFLLGRPCLTLRDETEWVELVAAGWNRLVPADPEALLRAVGTAVPPPGVPPAPYGDGRAGERIVNLLLAGAPDRRNAAAPPVLPVGPEGREGGHPPCASPS